MKKNLSNTLTLELLKIIGLSNKPLSTREIEIKWCETKISSESMHNKDKRNSQIYPKIKELSRIDYHKTDLTSYYDFINNLNDANYKLKLIKKIAKIVIIDSQSKIIDRINNTNYEINKNIILQYEFNRNTKKGFLKVECVDKSKYEFNTATISLDLNLNEVFLEIHRIDGLKYSLKGKLRKDDYNLDNFFLSFITKNLNPPLLDITFKENIQEKINKIQKNKKIVANDKTIKKKGFDNILFGVLPHEEWKEIVNNIENITQLKNDPVYFKYSLNLRGFLHYLLHVKSPEKVEKMIQSLLRNKVISYQFYFLNHTKSIDSILGGKKIRIEILRHVAKELESMLDYSSISELIQESTKRYFSKINRIISRFPGFSMRSIGDEGYKKWIEYKTRILKSMIGYEKNMLSNFQKELTLTTNQKILLETK